MMAEGKQIECEKEEAGYSGGQRPWFLVAQPKGEEVQRQKEEEKHGKVAIKVV
jgi:hypothetical protein